MEWKLRAGDYMIPVTVVENDNRLYFHFGFNRKLMGEIKVMQGRQYHGYKDATNHDWVLAKFGTDKIWSVPITPRNLYQLSYLKGGNPYAHYDQPPVEFELNRKEAYQHQRLMVWDGCTYHYCIWAAEMGSGKSLSLIEVMERSGSNDWWYVAPKSAIKSFERELERWDSKVIPIIMTYEGLTKRMREWKPGQLAPIGIAFDEASRVKNPSALRSQAARAVADGIRHDHGKDGFVIEMSGSPAPKSPLDWWNLCEIACPGFIREGSQDFFAERLGIFKQRKVSLGSFKEKIAWLDDERKCAVCGQFEADIVHSNCATPEATDDILPHEFQPSVNEVHKLYGRMKGLVRVIRKADCMELPPKLYHEIECGIKAETLAAARTIAARGKSAASTLILLRELSDGFQYIDVPNGTKPCEACDGQGTVPDYAADADGNIGMHCPRCRGERTEPAYAREVQEIWTPKDDAFLELLDRHSDVGRFITYAAFTGTIDKIVRLATSQKWGVIRVDGRGWVFLGAEGEVVSESDVIINRGKKLLKSDYRLTVFQELQEEFPRVLFVGHPDSAGMGLTLTASPSILYYSNSFNAESRIQSEDRIHRPGCTGANIFDLFHLPTDRLIANNLKMKRDLQNMTLGELAKTVDSADGRLF